MTEMKKNQKYIGLDKNTNIFKKCISVKLFITFLSNIIIIILKCSI